MYYYDADMGMDVGLRELRQRASEVVRQVEEGREVVVTVNGRPAARLVPVSIGHWREPAALDGVFAVGVDAASWARDIADIPDGIVDPWIRA